MGQLPAGAVEVVVVDVAVRSNEHIQHCYILHNIAAAVVELQPHERRQCQSQQAWPAVAQQLAGKS